jgi:hypothetical protein
LCYKFKFPQPTVELCVTVGNAMREHAEGHKHNTLAATAVTLLLFSFDAPVDERQYSMRRARSI